MNNSENAKTDELINLFRELQLYFKSMEKEDEKKHGLYNQFHLWEEAVGKEELNTGDFKMPAFQQQFEQYVNSSAGKEVIESVVSAVQKEINDNPDNFAGNYNYHALTSKILSAIKEKEFVDEELKSKERKDRINESVKNSIADALKDLKPWQGFSS